MTIVESTRSVTGGVDTHLDVHVVAAVDANGGVLGVESFPTTPAGYAQLHRWLRGFGDLAQIGVEGTGAYGAGLARYLRRHDLEVIEVDRPNRQLRRRSGKSDAIDAIEAARAALSGRATGVAKTADGDVEAIRALLVARRSARDVRIKYLNQIRHLSFTAPDELREQLRDVSRDRLARTAAALRPRAGSDTVTYATKLAIQTLGRRVLALEADSARLDQLLDTLVHRTRAQPAARSTASGSTPRRSCSSRRATTHTDSATKPPSRTSAASHPSQRPPEKSPATDSTPAGTAKPTTPSGGSCSPA